MHHTLNDPHLRRRYDVATQPEVARWLEDHPDRAAQLSPAELDELLSLQGVGGPLTGEGIEFFLQVIERKRSILQKISVLAGTEHLEVLEKIVDVFYRDVQPYVDRG